MAVAVAARRPVPAAVARQPLEGVEAVQRRRLRVEVVAADFPRRAAVAERRCLEVAVEDCRHQVAVAEVARLRRAAVVAACASLAPAAVAARPCVLPVAVAAHRLAPVSKGPVVVARPPQPSRRRYRRMPARLPAEKV